MASTIQTLNLIDWHEVVAIVGHGVVTLAVLTYWAGWGSGRVVHYASGWLARSPQPQPASLTARIVALRAEGLSQRAIADAVGVSRTTVRRRLAMA